MQPCTSQTGQKQAVQAKIKYANMLTQNRNRDRQNFWRNKMQNPSAAIVEYVCEHFLEKPPLFPCDTVPKSATSFVRLHSDKLNVSGDFSFPCSTSIWKNGCCDTGYKLRTCAFEMFHNDPESAKAEAAKVDFLKATKRWMFPVERLQVQNERCTVFLQRNVVIKRLLHQVLNKDVNVPIYGKLEKNPKQRIWLRVASQSDEEAQDLSNYRAKLVEDTLRRVLEYSKWSFVTEEEANAAKDGTAAAVMQLNVVSVIAKEATKQITIPPSQLTYATVRCGLVTDPLTAKMTKVKASEYLSCRSNDMRLMAMHKYGLRVQNDERFGALMARLGSAAVTVDLMEVRFSSPVQIIRSGKGSTRGAAFILYNSARLESLLRLFEQRVQNGEYDALPPLNNVDLTLLDEEEEWQLIFGYIFAFPNLIERCVEHIERGMCATHLIVRFLGDFVSVFSVYYRRIRILIQETRTHLMPYVYARVYLVKAVREILNRTLALLDIEPVEFM